MAFDESLADRFRSALERLPLEEGETLSEKKMFGGLCFHLHRNREPGKMLGGVLGSQIIVRMTEDEYHAALEAGEITPFDFTGRPAKTIAFLVDEEAKSDQRLLRWIEASAAYVRVYMLSQKSRSRVDRPKRAR